MRIRILNDQGKFEFNKQVFAFEQGNYALSDNKRNEGWVYLLHKQAAEVILIDAENKVSTQSIVSFIDYLHTQGFENVSLGNTFEENGIN